MNDEQAQAAELQRQAAQERAQAIDRAFLDGFNKVPNKQSDPHKQLPPQKRLKDGTPINPFI